MFLIKIVHHLLLPPLLCGACCYWPTLTYWHSSTKNLWRCSLSLFVIEFGWASSSVSRPIHRTICGSLLVFATHLTISSRATSTRPWYHRSWVWLPWLQWKSWIGEIEYLPEIKILSCYVRAIIQVIIRVKNFFLRVLGWLARVGLLRPGRCSWGGLFVGDRISLQGTVIRLTWGGGKVSSISFL